MENISNFLSACEDIGVKKVDLFQTVDLFEGQNMPQVVTGLCALGRKVSNWFFNFNPLLDPKCYYFNPFSFLQCVPIDKNFTFFTVPKFSIYWIITLSFNSQLNRKITRTIYRYTLL